jgi:transcriptional regulator with XRE-family HTH domain
MDDPEAQAASILVGERIRQLRQDRKLSLRELARSSALSANALSMVERGLSSPSVSTLYRVAEGLGVSISSLFETRPARSAVVLCKASSRARMSIPRGLWEGLGGETFEGRVEPFVLTLENGSSSGPGAMIHTGHEFVYCLRGRLEYQIEGEIFRLDPGDSLLFRAYQQHRWRNPGTTVTQALVVLSGFDAGERPAESHRSHADDRSTSTPASGAASPAGRRPGG